jgi:hypothetical protein
VKECEDPMALHVEPVEVVMVKYKALICEYTFWSKEDQIYPWELGVAMQPKINFDSIMSHAYVRGDSYPHEICSTLRCFYYQLCGCGESFLFYIISPLY